MPHTAGYHVRPVKVSAHIPAPPEELIRFVADTRNDTLVVPQRGEGGSGRTLGLHARCGVDGVSPDVVLEVSEMELTAVEPSLHYL